MTTQQQEWYDELQETLSDLSGDAMAVEAYLAWRLHGQSTYSVRAHELYIERLRDSLVQHIDTICSIIQFLIDDQFL